MPLPHTFILLTGRSKPGCSGKEPRLEVAAKLRKNKLQWSHLHQRQPGILTQRRQAGGWLHLLSAIQEQMWEHLGMLPLDLY